MNREFVQAYWDAIDWCQLKFEEFRRKYEKGEVEAYVVPYSDGRIWASRTRFLYKGENSSIKELSGGKPAMIITNAQDEPYILLSMTGDMDEYQSVHGMYDDETIRRSAEFVKNDTNKSVQELLTIAFVDLRMTAHEIAVYTDLTSKPIILSNSMEECIKSLVSMEIGDHILLKKEKEEININRTKQNRHE